MKTDFKEGDVVDVTYTDRPDLPPRLNCIVQTAAQWLDETTVGTVTRRVATIGGRDYSERADGSWGEVDSGAAVIISPVIAPAEPEKTGDLDEVAALLEEHEALYQERKRLEKIRSEAHKRMEAIVARLADIAENRDFDKFPIFAGLPNYQISFSNAVKTVDKRLVADWAISEGKQNLLSIHAQTLAGIINDYEKNEEPIPEGLAEGIEVTLRTTLSRRKNETPGAKRRRAK